MKLAGAAVVPSAPVLVPGMTAGPLPSALAALADELATALAALAPSDPVLLLAGAPGSGDGAVYEVGEADLGGLARPDLHARVTVPPLASRIADALALPLRGGPLPVDLAVLALHAAAAPARPVAPVAVPWLPGARLLELAERLAAVLHEGRVSVLASGDLSAGLTEKAPRHLVPGAQEWDRMAHDALRDGDVAALAALGPQEARRVASRSWPALVVLAGLLSADGVTPTIRQYAAPRGVGYLVASA